MTAWLRWLQPGHAGAWIVCLGLMACKSGPRDPHRDDTQTFGDVLILADEAFKPVLEDEKMVFENFYEKAHLRIRYLPERDLTRAMLNDSVRCVFAAFVPGAEQQAYFRTRNLTPHIEAVLTDGIAVVVPVTSPTDSLSLDELRGILQGGREDRRVALFDGTSTGVVRTLVDSLFGGEAAAVKNAGAVNGIDSLLARVAVDPDAVGFLPYAWISDLDDPEHSARRALVKLLAVSGGPGRKAVRPTQGTLADGQYPLRRKLYMMVTEGRSGLGTGFASFVAGHKGQRIILKQGLAPAHIPSREVMIVNE
jgi:phosphate transport system substrate-binding protein